MSQPHSLQHVGITVSNIERSLTWYTSALGAEASEITTVADPSLARALGVGDAVTLRFAFLDTGTVLVELIEYLTPRGRGTSRRNSDVGSVHLCFSVADIDAAQDRLSLLGARFTTEPLVITGGQLRGARYVYFTDPDGIQLQLLESTVPAHPGHEPRQRMQNGTLRNM